MSKELKSQPIELVGKSGQALLPVCLSDDRSRSILHDLYQPLTAISNYAQTGRVLAGNGVRGADEEELFSRIFEQTRRMEEICREIEVILNCSTEKDRGP